LYLYLYKFYNIPSDEIYTVCSNFFYDLPHDQSIAEIIIVICFLYAILFSFKFIIFSLKFWSCPNKVLLNLITFTSESQLSTPFPFSIHPLNDQKQIQVFLLIFPFLKSFNYNFLKQIFFINFFFI
jgi:hypothetical protein